MKFIRIIVILAIAGCLLGAAFILKTVYDAGEFKKLTPHFRGRCMVVKGIESSEDITITKTGFAFISSDDRRPWYIGKRGRRGNIYGYDLKVNDSHLINLTREFPGDFHPHGIGLYQEQGLTRLFVINHKHDGQFVEVFDYIGNKLVHLKSISGTLMNSPNDIIPAGPESFYVTNDHGSTTRFGKALEDYLQLADSYVLYYDGNEFHKVAQGIAYANGINVSPDMGTVFVASTTAKKILVFRRGLYNGSLKLVHRIKLTTAPDNIEVDRLGRLWVGAHPKLLTFVRYAKSPEKTSPSEILKITPKRDGQYEIEQVYLSEGKPISGSSVGAYYNGTLLIGSVFDPLFIACKCES